MKTVIISITILVSTAVYSSPYQFNQYFIDAASKVKPSVVNIVSYTKKVKGNGYKLIKNAYGTGTIISRNGFVVTNFHLLKDSNYFHIVDYKGNRYEVRRFENGKHYVSDPKTDLAVLKLYSADKKFVPVKFSDSNVLVEGEWVIAVGNPYGLKQSITAGIVSSTGRDNIGFTDIEDFIQSDVSINPGNSGGPLVNLYGQLVGINTAIRSESGGFQGISFSIPSNIVKRVCFDLVKYGRVKRGWLGLIAAERRAGSKSSRKLVEVVSVLKGSPSENGGIRPGDVINKIDGKKITGLGSLMRTVGNKNVNSSISFELSRDGKLIRLSFLLREKRDYVKVRENLKYIFERFGIEFDINSLSNEIVISYVSPNSPFSQLKRGDTVLSINNRRVYDINSLLNILKNDELLRLFYKFEILRDSRVYEIKINK